MPKTEDEKGTEIWVDERGSKVLIHSFFSKVYIDSETQRLSKEYQIRECDGNSRCSTLGSANRECFAAHVLILSRVAGFLGGDLVGMKKTELEKAVDRPCYINEFINRGLLREKWIMGDLVVFPTEELLKNQKISKRR
jgi:hypothetical protein